MTDDVVLCCPHCKSSDLRRYNGRTSPVQHEENWGCEECGRRFDDAETRKPKGAQVVKPNSLAGKLDRMDPDDLDLSGGETA